MADLSGFNAEEIEVSTSYDPVPPGWYPAVITESEMRDTRAGTGRYLALTLELVDCAYAGRRVWTNLNLHNPNEKAVEIAYRDLASICRAIGIMQPRDSEDLHFKKLEVKLAIQKDNADRNECKGYRALENAAPAAAAKSAAAPKTSTPPWKR
jgi:hypothetical protein